MCDCCSVAPDKEKTEASEEVEEITTEVKKRPKLL